MFVNVSVKYIRAVCDVLDAVVLVYDSVTATACTVSILLVEETYVVVVLQCHCRVCTGNVARLVTAVPIGCNGLGSDKVLECLQLLIIYTHIRAARAKRH